MNRFFTALSAAQRYGTGIALSCLLPTALFPRSAVAAERIYASYTFLERSISVSALEDYARKGELDDDLAVYAQYVTPQQLQRLRRVLLLKVDLSPVAVSQFLYTPQGEALLQRLGGVIQTESRQPGFYALRAALILAASEPEGLTLLNVLRKFPTRSIRIDLARSLEIAGQLERVFNQSSRVTVAISQLFGTEVAKQPTVDLSQSPDLRKPGRFTWKKQTLTLYDLGRARIFLTDIYIPRTSAATPVIVISHGVGSDRTSFEYLATQLASYGFAVAVPDHPGSDAKQLRSLLTGRASEGAEPTEFINRPLDVTYLLDEMERLDRGDSSFQLNMDQVGVVGQSFGGYTALALVGAKLNFDQLDRDCLDIDKSWNVSLLLQCRVRDLPRTDYNLQDKRVKAAIAINPVTSSVFGQASISQVQVPVMIIAGTADTVTPAFSEQILPFTWLSTPSKYLAVIENATHFSAIGQPDSSQAPVPLPDQVIGSEPALVRRYVNVFSVAFFQTHVVGVPQYRPYLSPAYAKTLSQPPLNLSLLQSLNADQLAQALD